MLFRIFILIGLILLIDLYVFQGIKVLFRGSAESTGRIACIIFWALTASSIVVILGSYFVPEYAINKTFRTYLLSLVIILLMSKMLFALFLIVDDVFRLMRWLASLVSKDSSNVELQTNSDGISRLKFLSQIGITLSAIPFLSLIYGMTKGAFNYYVNRQRIKFSKLPESFNGMKMIQISDLHTGSFHSDSGLRKAVDIIMKQKADIIVFTGDMVNSISDEVYPYIDVLGKLKAPLGVYAIMGNHDYGDYMRWESEDQKAANLVKLKDAYRKMGWRLLLDENVPIEKDGSRINLIGVQNWSAKGHFKNYGDLAKAVAGVSEDTVNVLLSHDPSHWRAEVTEQFPFIDLTLSGHTHGFQFGVKIPGWKWSPVQYVYKEWSGLYKQGAQRLYVNTGLGFLGYPGRVGMSPEITLFEFEPEGRVLGIEH